MNLVAPDLPLARLPDNDPALVEFRSAVHEETGIEVAFVDQLLDALKEAYHLGSLLKVEDILGEAMKAYEARALDDDRSKMTAVSAQGVLLDKLQDFLTRHTGRDDLGLHLRGEQLAAGIRFVEMLAHWGYDIVVANPPYAGNEKLAAGTVTKRYLSRGYRLGKADLYGAFIERGLQLARPHGEVAMVTKRGWMFIEDFEKLCTRCVKQHGPYVLADLQHGAFDEVGGQVVSTVLWCLRRGGNMVADSGVALRGPADKGSDVKKASLLSHSERFDFRPSNLRTVAGSPIIYWWSDGFRREYQQAPKLGEETPVEAGVKTTNDWRFVRKCWENRLSQLSVSYDGTSQPPPEWPLYAKGARGCQWFEPSEFSLNWRGAGLELRTYHVVSPNVRLRQEERYFQPFVAFAPVGKNFMARVVRLPTIFGNMSSAIFPEDIPNTVCLMNDQTTQFVAESLNPGVHFELRDAKRLPVRTVRNAGAVFTQLERAFLEAENSRETSCEFRRVGRHTWSYAQGWAAAAIEQDELPEWNPTFDMPTGLEVVSYALGAGIGRFGRDGEGWLDDAPQTALPHGILYLSASDAADSLDHDACEFLRETWADHGAEITTKHDLGSWLRERWFVDVHCDMYEKRPIYFPLSSQNKNFVAHVSIHRWTEDTLRHLLADHLYPEKQYLEGLRDDLAQAKASGGSGARDAEDRYAQVVDWLEELEQFIADVEQCAEKGPPPTDAKCPPREVDARYAPVLDDGVMINSAALWPLLEPQWKDPKNWWKQLATEKGFRGKHFDWSHLAMRYWPTRVDAKCQEDPSLAVAHGCFWKYHPERAYEWELRLQYEIEPDFTIDEDGSDDYRAAFVAEHAGRAQEIHDAEMKRREKEEVKKADKAQQELV